MPLSPRARLGNGPEIADTPHRDRGEWQQLETLVDGLRSGKLGG